MSDPVQRLFDVFENVGRVLDAYGETEQAVADAMGFAFLGRVSEVNARRRNDDRASRVSPRLTARVTSLSRFMKARPAEIPPSSSKAMSSPGADICRLASSNCGKEGNPGYEDERPCGGDGASRLRPGPRQSAEQHSSSSVLSPRRIRKALIGDSVAPVIQRRD